MSSGKHETEIAAATSSAIGLRKIASYSGLRVLAWDDDVLYACRGYQLVCLQTAGLQRKERVEWEPVARFQPLWWRNLTSRFALTHRLVRDGFHALAVPGDKTMIAAVPGAIVTRTPASAEFRPTHQILRGTRPLHITAIPGGNIYWGEYFDNRERAEVHIYASADSGQTWHVAYTFPARAIRHVHNIGYDQWGDCLWILTGDEGPECKVLRASRDLRSVETVLSGSQQARAVAAIPTQDALYFATDTPSERNHILRLDRGGGIEPIAGLASSSIFGCRTANSLFFSTMAEPSEVNTTREVHLVGSADGTNWKILVRWQKDILPMHYFQYGNAILPDGENSTNYLAATTVAVKQDDLVTTLWEVNPSSGSREPRAERPIP
jgi:hypothetical protein